MLFNRESLRLMSPSANVTGPNLFSMRVTVYGVYGDRIRCRRSFSRYLIEQALVS